MHSRLGEEGSPKRDLAGSHCSHSSTSRLSEGSPPERGKPLTWASTLSLSETWARMCLVLISSVLLDECHMYGWIIVLKYILIVYAWVMWFMGYELS